MALAFDGVEVEHRAVTGRQLLDEREQCPCVYALGVGFGIGYVGRVVLGFHQAGLGLLA